MERQVLIIVRNDVGADARALIQTSLGFDVTEWLASTKLRRTGDTAGTSSHRVAHGHVPDRLWDDLVSILQDATDGVRDSVDWQDKPTTAIADADWAVAYAGTDIVAAYHLTAGNARATIAAAGLVFTSRDDPAP